MSLSRSERSARSVVKSGNGSYHLLRNADDVASKIIDELEGMEQKSLGAVVFSSYASYFQYFLALAFVLLTIEFLLPGSKLKTRAS